MANTLITPTALTRESLRVLHQKLNFIGSITREYDDQFAKSGAKIGDTLRIRKPNRFTVRTGATMDVQHITETYETLQVATQKGVDINFTIADLTLTIDRFSERYIEPAMSQLASAIEADAMTMYKDVYQQVNNLTAAASYRGALLAGKMLDDSLAPMGSRTFNMNTQDRVDLADALKGLFNPQAVISDMFRDGMLGEGAGFKWAVNTLWPSHTTGSAAGDATGTVTATAYTLNGAQEGNTITLTPGSNAGTLLKGDVITISGLYRVHPESRGTTTTLQQFVITTAVAASATSIVVSPSIVTSGANQNVAAIAASGAAVYKVGATSDTHALSMAYHKEAFAFATADLIMPGGVDFAAREVVDGISMRIVRAYDITNDQMPCRLDVLYGYKTIRPELAVRVANN